MRDIWDGNWYLSGWKLIEKRTSIWHRFEGVHLPVKTLVGGRERETNALKIENMFGELRVLIKSGQMTGFRTFKKIVWIIHYYENKEPYFQIAFSWGVPIRNPTILIWWKYGVAIVVIRDNSKAEHVNQKNI